MKKYIKVSSTTAQVGPGCVITYLDSSQAQVDPLRETTKYDGDSNDSTYIPRDIALESEDRQDVYEVQSVCLHN